jgi:NAD(P)-dependent dehydrogenase (short-subunit alcohol dehydrogenase family)
MRFTTKHVVVTGAASGLGLAIAKAAEAEGATIIAIDRVAVALHRTIASATSPMRNRSSGP